MARGRRQQRRQNLDECCLPGAIRPHQAEGFSGLHTQTEPVERAFSIEALADLFDFDHVLGSKDTIVSAWLFLTNGTPSSEAPGAGSSLKPKNTPERESKTLPPVCGQLRIISTSSKGRYGN